LNPPLPRMEEIGGLVADTTCLCEESVAYDPCCFAMSKESYASGFLCLRYMYMYLPNLSYEYYCVLESFTASQLVVYGNFIPSRSLTCKLISALSQSTLSKLAEYIYTYQQDH
jgi:hypothetical protein